MQGNSSGAGIEYFKFTLYYLVENNPQAGLGAKRSGKRYNKILLIR